MTIDLPDRTNITHDDCSTIIEAWRNGRLIDREAIDYEAAVAWLHMEMSPVLEPLTETYWSTLARTVESTIGVALGLDKETTT